MSEEGRVVKIANKGVSPIPKDGSHSPSTAKQECAHTVAQSSDGSREAVKFGNFSVKSPTFQFSIGFICGTLHKFACHPYAGAMLIFSESFQF